jgi:hypothetical protein
MWWSQYIYASCIIDFGGPCLAGKDSFTFMFRDKFFCLKGICFPSLECRIRDSICVTQVLYGEGILWYDDCALANLFKPPIFSCHDVCPARIKLWMGPLLLLA